MTNANLGGYTADDFFDTAALKKKISESQNPGGQKKSSTRGVDSSMAMDNHVLGLHAFFAGADAYNGPADALAEYERVVTTSTSHLWNEVKPDQDGLRGALPFHTKIFDQLNPGGPSLGTGGTNEPTGTGGAEKVIAIARGELQYAESPSGSNKTKFAREVGVADGLPWCSTFMKWCFDKAGLKKEAGRIHPAVATTFDNYAKDGLTGSKPKVGALVQFTFSHIGLVVAINDDGSITTIEGNTSPTDAGDQRNGGGVYEKKRAKSIIKQYAYPEYPAPDPATSGGAGAEAGSPNVTGGPSKKGFIWPTKVKTVTSGFRTSSRPNHEGIDIGCSVGSEIYATKGGTVTHAETQSGYGYVIYLDHGSGVTSRYAHLWEYKVKAGDKVTQGQLIALSGGEPGDDRLPAASIGTSTGAHLHFEILVNGTPKDPEDYL